MNFLRAVLCVESPFLIDFIDQFWYSDSSRFITEIGFFYEDELIESQRNTYEVIHD